LARFEDGRFDGEGGLIMKATAKADMVMTRRRRNTKPLERSAWRAHDAAVSRKVEQALHKLNAQDLDSVRHLEAARRDEGTES
jgi:hypothetical protein